MNNRFDTIITIVVVLVVLFAVITFLFAPRKKYEKEYEELENEFSAVRMYFEGEYDISFSEAKESFDKIDDYFQK